MADTVDSTRVREFNEEDTPEFEEKINKLAEMVKASRYTVFFTGAGISTSAGVGDYRGPSGAWTQRKIKQLECKRRTPEEEEELKKLKLEAAREEKKATKKVSMNDAQPTATHMAMSTLIRVGKAHFVITTNLVCFGYIYPDQTDSCSTSRMASIENPVFKDTSIFVIFMVTFTLKGMAPENSI